MTAPRLEINLTKIFENARVLIAALAQKGIEITGVTKSVMGCPKVTDSFARAGITQFGDSRIKNVERMRQSGVSASISLIRSPMVSEAERVVRNSKISFNTEIDVISSLSSAAEACGVIHGVVLMIELGDLREGIMPGDLIDTVRRTLRFPGIKLKGIGTNLACRSGVAPEEKNMGQLSALADIVENTFGIRLEIVSGGNSANLNWALSGADTGRINNLRLGEAIILGRETLHRRPIKGLHTDAISIVAEIIELKAKPSRPWGQLAQNAFGVMPPITDRGTITQAIAALGHFDVDPNGLIPSRGMKIIGAGSDHLVLDVQAHQLRVGSEVEFDMNYSALIRAMASPFVTKVMKENSDNLKNKAAIH